MLNALNSILEIGKGFCAYHQVRREILEQKEIPDASIDFLTSIHILVSTTGAAGPWLPAKSH